MALHSRFQVVLLHKNYRPTTSDINCDHNRNYKLYLTSYNTWRATSQKVLRGARFGIGIFDESHCVKNSKTLTFATVRSMDCKYKIQLTGTPMHHCVRDWVVQAQWLHAQSSSVLLSRYGYQTMDAACKAVKGGKDSSPGSYLAIRDWVIP